MTGKQISVEEAIALIPDGAALGVGGVLLKRKPIALVSALAASGRSHLRLYSFLASLDAEILVGHSCLAEVHAGYVGFEHLGFAPTYQAAVASGAVRFVEYTEFLFVAGLRASLAGLPFMPTKGGTGSDVLKELGFVEIPDPYGHEPVIAVPALTPDVTVLHAEAADTRGNVLGPFHPDFLWDSDAVLARAAQHVIVTCEQMLTVEELRADPRPTLLYGYEVDAVVHAPDGARPTAMPGRYETNTEEIRSYLEAVAADPVHAADLLGQVT